MENQSRYDPSRPTVGHIYREINSRPATEHILVGDMCNEMMKGLVEDINDGIQLRPFKDQGDPPWYIMIHEKRDLQMPNSFLRRILHFKKRPWPEDDTTVFWHNPQTLETRFCWSLPHHAEMTNIIANENLFHPDLVSEVKAWKRFDLTFFGFTKDVMGNYVPNPRWKDRPLEAFSRN